jgi:hypothetical protein
MYIYSVSTSERSSATQAHSIGYLIIIDVRHYKHFPKSIPNRKSEMQKEKKKKKTCEKTKKKKHIMPNSGSLAIESLKETSPIP